MTSKTTKNRKCLYCYDQTEGSKEIEYHPKCSIRLFGTDTPPLLPYELSMINELASEEINKRLSITGVQPKISLGIEKEKGQNRLTIIGLWGGYIFKPPYNEYPEMPEIEDLTMHLAELSNIETSVHGLIRLKSGELGYITKRFDRISENGNPKKIYTEDLCQLTETMTINKYNSSMEKIGKTIQKFSEYSGLDKLKIFEITIFSFLTGNADMHLKNFSLYENSYHEITLSPCYDLIASKLLIPDDKEETALTINGKKRNLKKNDFISFANNMEIGTKVIDNIFYNFSSNIDSYMSFIEKGYISDSVKKSYKELIIKRAKTLNLV